MSHGLTTTGDERFAGQTIHGRWMAESFRPGLVSVIVPTHNRGDLISQSLDAVWRQTYRPIELLIVDDGSTDHTSGVVDRWRRQHGGDERFAVTYRRQSRRGAPSARNLGLIESCGEFIQFLDSDDVFSPHKFRLHVECLQKQRADFAWSDWELVEHERLGAFVRANFRQPSETALHEPVASVRRLSRLPTKAVVALFRRSVCRAIGPWHESLIRHQDWEYTTRMIACGANAVRVDCGLPLYVFRQHDQGQIGDLRKRRKAAVEARLMAALAAEENASRIGESGLSEQAMRRRIRSRFFSIMQFALRANCPREFVAAWSGLRRNLPWRASRAGTRDTAA